MKCWLSTVSLSIFIFVLITSTISCSRTAQLRVARTNNAPIPPGGSGSDTGTDSDTGAGSGSGTTNQNPAAVLELKMFDVDDTSSTRVNIANASQSFYEGLEVEIVWKAINVKSCILEVFQNSSRSFYDTVFEGSRVIQLEDTNAYSATLRCQDLDNKPKDAIAAISSKLSPAPHLDILVKRQDGQTQLTASENKAYEGEQLSVMVTAENVTDCKLTFPSGYVNVNTGSNIPISGLNTTGWTGETTLKLECIPHETYDLDVVSKSVVISWQKVPVIEKFGAGREGVCSYSSDGCWQGHVDVLYSGERLHLYLRAKNVSSCSVYFTKHEGLSQEENLGDIQAINGIVAFNSPFTTAEAPLPAPGILSYRQFARVECRGLAGTNQVVEKLVSAQVYPPTLPEPPAPPEPIVNITVNDNPAQEITIEPNSSVSLKWSVQHANQCTITPSISAPLTYSYTDSSLLTHGNYTFSSVSCPTEFYVTCNGPGGSTTKSTHVNVNLPARVTKTFVISDRRRPIMNCGSAPNAGRCPPTVTWSNGSTEAGWATNGTISPLPVEGTSDQGAAFAVVPGMRLRAISLEGEIIFDKHGSRIRCDSATRPDVPLGLPIIQFTDGTGSQVLYTNIPTANNTGAVALKDIQQNSEGVIIPPGASRAFLSWPDNYYNDNQASACTVALEIGPSCPGH